MTNLSWSNCFSKII